jgi:hypothetical protein
MGYHAAMLWRFADETIEDTETQTLHRPGCRELDGASEVDPHPAGSSITRDLAPRECWSCRPEIELELGV